MLSENFWEYFELGWAHPEDWESVYNLNLAYLPQSNYLESCNFFTWFCYIGEFVSDGKAKGLTLGRDFVEQIELW